MLHDKQQFFLLMAVSLGISILTPGPAISQDYTSGLLGMQWSSRLNSETVLKAELDHRNLGRHGDEIIGNQSSVLEMEEGQVSEPQRNKPSQNDDGEPEQNSNADEMQESSSPAPQVEDVEPPVRIERVPEPAPPRLQQPEPIQQQEPIQQAEPEPQQSAEPVQSAVPTRVEETTETIKSKASSKKISKKKNKKSKGRQVVGEQIGTVPQRVAPAVPAVAPQKTSTEEAMLSKLVKELEFGTLQNSIALLNQLTAKCPDDPDYKSLLAMALRLRDGDVWYSYQRKTEYKIEDKEIKPPPANIIKPVANESINELKKSSWFLIRSVKR